MSENITPATSVAIREPHYERVGLGALGASGGALVIQNMAEAVSVAQLMAKSGIAIRKHLREQPGACLGVLMQAMRWEFDPYMVANKSYAVNDQLAYEAQLIAAVVLTRAAIVDEPDYTYEGEPGTTRTCTVTFKMRSGKTLPYTTPEVKKITTKNSPLWKSDEDQQLGYFAVRSWARRHQPHVLLGVYTVEEAQEVIDITPGTSGVASRLPGAQNGAGFSHEGVQAEGERAAPKAARASRKPKGPAEDEDRPTTPEAPTDPATAQTAESEPDTPASVEPASEDSPDLRDSGQAVTEEPTTGGEQEAINEHRSQTIQQLDDAGALNVEVITEGYPAENEVYMLNGDEWVFDTSCDCVMRDVHKNGLPFSIASRDKGHKVYEDHAPATSQPSSEVEDEASDLPADLTTLITATETVDSWDHFKSAMGAFQKTALWPTLSDEQANHIRASAWQTLADRQVAWMPDPAHDISAFRLWVEDADEPAQIRATLALLQADEAAQGKAAALKSVSDAAAARLAVLEA